MKIKDRIKEFGFVVLCRVLLQQCLEAISVYKYVTAGNMHKTPIKLQTEISIAVHAIEKGMSIGGGRIGFGKEKALHILDNLQSLLDIGGDLSFAEQSVGTLRDYINYNVNNGANMDIIINKLDDFCVQNNLVKNYIREGLIMLNKQDVFKSIRNDFESFSQSRHSVRDFSDEPVDMDKVHKALKMNERTPSACNRQSWRIHVYHDKKICNKIFELQHGARGFYDKMQCAILVCADLNYYEISELNLAYVDGGLYAMNLLYSLHYQGLATIPLTMGIKYGVLNQIKKKMGISDNEAPVILIGVGSFKNEYKVAYSHRESYKDYTTFNK